MNQVQQTLKRHYQHEAQIVEYTSRACEFTESLYQIQLNYIVSHVVLFKNNNNNKIHESKKSCIKSLTQSVLKLLKAYKTVDFFHYGDYSGIL